MKMTKNQKLILGGVIVVFILANSNVVQAESPPRDPRKEFIQNEMRGFSNFMRPSNPGVHEEL